MTAAGAAREPVPKKSATDVSWPATGPRRAAANSVSGRSSPSPGSCAARSVRARASQRGSRSAIWRPFVRSNGLTAQYSNHETRCVRRVWLVTATSCTSTGSSPNGAATDSATDNPPARTLRR